MRRKFIFCLPFLSILLLSIALIASLGYAQKRDLSTFTNNGAPRFIVSGSGDTLFTEIPTSIINLAHGTTAWGDFDKDNDLDILVTGIGDRKDEFDSLSTHYSIIYRNDDCVFTDINAGLPGVNNNDGPIWNDYDNDGDLDIFIGGGTYSNGQYTPISKIFNNDNGVFTDIHAGLLGLIGTAAWGDFDNDADLDLLTTGSPDVGATFATRFYRNDNGEFTEIITPIPGVWGASAAWGDYDNDKDLDLLLTGYGTEGVTSRIFRNDNATFVNINAPLAQVNSSSSTWGDYDSDGDLDILITGDLYGEINAYTAIYRNDGGSFVETNPGIENIGWGQSRWVDFDNDGDLDIFVSGKRNDDSLLTKIYRNDGGAYVDIGADLLGVYYTGASWGDCDNDGDLDLLLIGFTKLTGVYGPSAPFTKLYRNNTVVNNLKPTAPGALSIAPQGTNSVQLQWSSASDAETPQNTLTYNLRVGTSPGGNDVISASSDEATGFRQVARGGNIKQSTDFILNDLEIGTYYWSVQAIDNMYTGSTFAKERIFAVTEEGIEEVTYPRWQLVSLPYTYSDTHTETIFPGAVSHAFSFSEQSGYVIADQLQNGNGYWLKFASSQSPSYPVGNSLATLDVPVNSGWNIIGSVDHTVSLPDDAIIESSIFSYGENGYEIAASIEKGRGYWVRTNAVGVIQLGASAKSGLSDVNVSNVSSLTIADASGARQTLYFGENRYSTRELRKFEMPPPPPAGIFDARYGSQRMMEVAEIEETKTQFVNITTENYPVTIT
ncbi:MAG: VCBS repeat-containing protein, partial [Bacteroidetes bacterium]